ncbi:hypothetical protein JRQ81_019363, partial [Phrynocephalus forsythii]
LVVHLGGNDLTGIMGKALILKVMDDLRAYKAQNPSTKIIWSAIVPRLYWGPSHHPKKMHKARKGVNREVARVVSSELGSVIWHPEITARRPELFRPDGVHLSDIGLELFLDDFREGLLAKLLGRLG